MSKLVVSGIPHGSVLGPLLFVLYIKDLNDAVRSNILLFADENFQTSYDDALQLQKDINALNSWSGKWLLQFNTDKCNVLTLEKVDNIMHTNGYMLYSN